MKPGDSVVHKLSPRRWGGDACGPTTRSPPPRLCSTAPTPARQRRLAFQTWLPCPRLSSLSHLHDLSSMGLDCPSGIPPHVNVPPAQLALKVDERTFDLLFTNQALSRNKAATCGSHSGHTESKLDDVDLSCSVGATHGMKCNCSQPRKRRIHQADGESVAGHGRLVLR